MGQTQSLFYFNPDSPLICFILLVFLFVILLRPIYPQEASRFVPLKRKRHLAKTYNYLRNKRTHLESTNVPWLPYLCMYSVGSAHLPSNNIPINVPPVAQLRYPTEDNTRVFTRSNPSIVSLPMILPGRVFHRISLLCTPPRTATIIARTGKRR